MRKRKNSDPESAVHETLGLLGYIGVAGLGIFSLIIFIALITALAHAFAG